MTRTDTSLTPLITAAEIFPALETLMAEAKSELLMSFRIFDPETRLRTPELRERGLETWGDLVEDTCARGVRIRLLMSDFDALFVMDLHRDAWRNAQGFARRMSGDSDVLCTPHGQIAGSFWRLLFRSKIRARIQELTEDGADLLTEVQKRILESGPVLRPVSLHQKFAVADGERAVLGGLDVDERRWDDTDHDREAEQTWHDVSLGVSGPLCADIRAHFVECWNEAVENQAPSMMQAGEPLPSDAVAPGGDLPRIVRTLSQPYRNVTALGPRARIIEHEDALVAAFGRARRHIYVETQFFRHKPLAEALAQAGNDNPELQFVMVMPTAPERIVFGGDDGMDARHAQALQVRNLDLCKRAFGDRMAVISPAQPRRARSEDESSYEGADIVYVHAKVTLIDDEWGMVGSANLNGRSMRWDTEASIAFDDVETIRTLRERLAEIWLGSHEDRGDIRLARTWERAAHANVERPPEDRDGFVLPHPIEKNRRFAHYLPVLPADMF